MSKGGLETAGRTNNQYKNDKIIDVPEIAAGSNPDLVSSHTDEAESPETIQRKQEALTAQRWLTIARDAYLTSEDYFDASIRKDIERNLSHFNLKHAPGSKYYTDLYKFRSRGFRPKTRSVIRQNEAKAAIALFSTSQAAHVKAENDSDPHQNISAEINQEILQYRLDNTMHWFQTAMGAYQDSMNTGVCISYQHWNYQEITEEEVLKDDDGVEVFDEMTGDYATGIRRTVIKDTPNIDLRPIENVRFSPSADWRDPLGTSPYIVDLLPMELGDAKEMIGQRGKTKIPWREDVTEDMLKQGYTEDFDPIRNVREKNRQDSKDQKHEITDFDIIWIHRNIVRVDGRDWIYYTLSTQHLLSDPIPLEKEYPHLKPGTRPYTLGVSIIETHKTYPESPAGLGAGLQSEANDINNQRRDNVQLVLNRRYYARRGAQIDYRSLIRNIPGSVTEMDNIDKDIRSEAPPEVTGSAYQEQDRINMDFDELMGSFSTSSVSSNRQLNETVGGMELLSGSANDVSEYQLRTFVQTWAIPALKQVVQMIQYYEDDEAILKIAGNKIDAWQRFGINKVVDRMIQGSMNIELNVGFGATNPKQRIDKLALGMNFVLKSVPGMAMRVNGDEVAKEVFGVLGYDGADRFFPPVDPNNPPKAPEDPKVTVEKMRIQSKQQEMQFMSEHEMRMKRLDQAFEDQLAKADRRMKLIESKQSNDGKQLEMSHKEKMSFQDIKRALTEAAMRERGQNERFAAERRFAETTGDGRGI